ncbi:MAG: hypothetical protein ISS29_01165 [Candidatus Marinimicrobia bacterium]|nr:hypothetical protein [Candidatus Neomarinimicrobiota bacterium]
MHTKAQNTMPIFIENQFYHVYNRANGEDKLFYTDANYLYFLAKLNSYISTFVEIYAYCLIPNHFHLPVKVKDIPTPVRFTKLISPEEKESNKPDRCNCFEFGSGLNLFLLIVLIPVNFHFMKSYDINVENQSAFFHILNQMRSIGGNVFQLYKADMMESFPYIDNVMQ